MNENLVISLICFGMSGVVIYFVCQYHRVSDLERKVSRLEDKVYELYVGGCKDRIRSDKIRTRIVDALLETKEDE